MKLKCIHFAICTKLERNKNNRPKRSGGTFHCTSRSLGRMGEGVTKNGTRCRGEI